MLIATAVDAKTHAFGDRGQWFVVVGLLAVGFRLHVRFVGPIHYTNLDRSVFGTIQFAGNVRRGPCCATDWGQVVREE